MTQPPATLTALHKATQQNGGTADQHAVAQHLPGTSHWHARVLLRSLCWLQPPLAVEVTEEQWAVTDAGRKRLEEAAG